ncbi:hypothetical protein Slin15195_G047810 [Septoria linicola]|uniref:Uncharacterized protein n=1 Tax=Septoria linicola TaxID=215465 RepID=A0A9Q9ASZ8_9PEZI|nr:hypothetical protein Slin14017_G051350 [Septoria linicola]USW51462.1 hypothetical protein Slin15195_G047810 [Septoria linicola]
MKPPSETMEGQPHVPIRKGTGERPGTPGTETSEAPSLIRCFPQEPRYLDRNYDRTGGSEAAAWRHQFLKVIESHTSEMTIDERTEFFEACITRNKDRYIQTFAAYYGQHPEHIPDRPGGVKSTKQEQDGMRESPEIESRQEKLFKTAWTTTNAAASPFEQKRNFIPDTVAGPKGEVNPQVEPPTCKHCTAEARKERWRSPLVTLGRMFGTKTKARPTSQYNHMQQHDGATSTASISLSSTAAASSSKSSLKHTPLPRGRHHDIAPTEPAQHVEQQA